VNALSTLLDNEEDKKVFADLLRLLVKITKEEGVASVLFGTTDSFFPNVMDDLIKQTVAYQNLTLGWMTKDEMVTYLT